jgi:hypothetical protein
VPGLLEDAAQTKAAMSHEMGSQLDRLNWFDVSGPDRTQGIKRLAEYLARCELTV